MKRQTPALFFLVPVLCAVMWSCVDVDQANIETRDFRSLIRFSHVAFGSQAAGPVTVDGAAVGTIGYLQSTPYVNLPAGGRTVTFAGASKAVTFNTDQQGTVYIFTSGATPDFLFVGEGEFTKDFGQPSVALVKFIHAARGFAPNLAFLDNSATGSPLAAAVPFNTDQPYLVVSPGSHQVFIVSGGEYMATVVGSQEVPSVNTRSSGTGAFTFNVAGDSLRYSISVAVDNTVGVADAFYFAAHFHPGAAGVVGPPETPIPLDSQKVSFPTITLNGLNEVPPETTTARGTSTFTLIATAGGTSFQLRYSITVTADTLDPFIASDFYTGAAGTNGPVVRNISGPVGDTTLAGTWATSDAVQPLTAALVDSLLKGRVYVNFLTAAHPNGAIRAQVVPDSTTVNVYPGVLAGIADSKRDSIMAGNYYVNFHTTTNPGGQIRGQVVVDPSKGHYGVTSLPLADTSFSAGRVYTVVVFSEANDMRASKLSNRQLGTSKPAGEPEPSASKEEKAVETTKNSLQD